MSAAELLMEFSERGIRVRPNGVDVTVSPRSALTPDLVQRIKREKSLLLRELEKIRREAGADWQEISSNPRQLKTFYELLMIVEMRNAGIAPPHYIAETECKHCGPVPIWDGCPKTISGCPWCFNRIDGRPMPNARRSDVAPAICEVEVDDSFDAYATVELDVRSGGGLSGKRT